jgi:threonyl-tRNA synthetase
VVVAPVSAITADYAAAIVARLRARLVRAELADTAATVAKNVRAAAARKVPVTLVVGERERADSRVAVRIRGRKQLWQAALGSFEESIVGALARRAGTFDPD